MSTSSTPPSDNPTTGGAGSTPESEPPTTGDTQRRKQVRLRSHEERLDHLKQSLAQPPGQHVSAKAQRRAESHPDGNILFGVALHAVSRMETPDQLSKLEKTLIELMSSYATPEELKAYGQLFQDSKKTMPAGGTTLIPDAVATMPESQPFTHDDLERFLDRSNKSFVNQSSVVTADASQLETLTQSNTSSSSSRFWVNPGKVENDGTRTWIFLGTGETVNAPATPASAEPLLARVRLASFQCLRRLTEGSGSDEPYFSTSGGDDERAHWTYKSQNFGKVKNGTKIHFDADAYAFLGPVNRHLALNIEVWEHDDDGEAWLTALRKVLCDVGNGMMDASQYATSNSLRVDMYAQSAAAVALLMDALISWLTNHDDFINRGKVIFTRKAMEEMLKAQPPTIFSAIVLDGDDRGEYSAGKYRVDFVVDRPDPDITYHSTAMNNWQRSIAVPAPKCVHASVVAFDGKLQAVVTRDDGMMLYMKYVNGKWSWPRTIPGALMRSYNAPSLTVRAGCLWVAFKDPSHVPRLARTYIADGVDGDWTNMWTGHAPTPGHIYLTFSGPSVVWFQDKFYLAWRHGNIDGEPWGARHGLRVVMGPRSKYSDKCQKQQLERISENGRRASIGRFPRPLVRSGSLQGQLGEVAPVQSFGRLLDRDARSGDVDRRYSVGGCSPGQAMVVHQRPPRPSLGHFLGWHKLDNALENLRDLEVLPCDGVS